ncbi:hypothetical protein DL240490_01270 [Mycobacterium marinum]|nr:hypothetical protein DL240490_01270 [Mycobacterium marinum]
MIDHHAAGRPGVDHLGRTRLASHHQRRRFQTLRRQHRHCGGGLRQHIDLFGHQQSMQIGRGAGDRLGHHHQPAPMQQCTPHFKDRQVEGVGVALGPDLSRWWGESGGGDRGEQLGDVVVGDPHAFGLAGRARGIDQIRDVVCAGKGQLMAGIARRDRGIIDIDHRHRITRQPLRQPRGTDHRYRRGILDHEPDTPIRMIDIDR